MTRRSRLRGDGPFVLRREQLDVLADVYTAQKFEERLMETMRANWPEECVALGEIGLRRRIMTGVCRATEYGFSEESEIGRFMNLIFLWGDDFDRDESRPKVLEILRSSTLSSRNRISQLINLAADELDKVDDEEEL
jgi:hypothetical protein